MVLTNMTSLLAIMEREGVVGAGIEYGVNPRRRRKLPRFGTVGDVMALVGVAAEVRSAGRLEHGYAIVAKLTDGIVGSGDAVDLVCALAALASERSAKWWLTSMPPGGESVFVTGLVYAVERAVDEERKRRSGFPAGTRVPVVCLGPPFWPLWPLGP